jgi:hypothetical protein
MKTKSAMIVAAFVCIYVGIYLALSLNGAYMPVAWGTNGIKSWAWTPKYFADESGYFRARLFYVFLPLFWLDDRYWHNDWTGESGPQKLVPRPTSSVSPARETCAAALAEVAPRLRFLVRGGST